MATILLIETATSVCSVALAKEGKIISIRETQIKNSHSSVVTVFSDEVVKETGLSFNEIDAFAVSMGPGSYTGLRIGVSTAKGFAFATEKKLIGINTLQSLTAGMVRKIEKLGKNPQDYLYCPMIDARRMEVYAAVYNDQTKEIEPTKAIIIDGNSFSGLLKNRVICFAGDGADKCKESLQHQPNAFFIDEVLPSAANMASLAEERFNNGLFEDVAYFEPYYLKDFVAGIPKVKGLR